METRCDRRQDCCGILKFWCFEKGANPSKPWHDRNNCYSAIAGIGMALGMVVACGLFMISPIIYGGGLLMQVIYGTEWVSGTDKIDYEYWMNVFLGMFGFMQLMICVICLIAGIALVYIIVMGIVKCTECWNDCAKDYRTDLENRESIPLITISTGLTSTENIIETSVQTV